MGNYVSILGFVFLNLELQVLSFEFLGISMGELIDCLFLVLIFSLETLVWEPSFRNFHLGSVSLKLSLRKIRLGTLAWKLSFGNVRLGNFALALSLGNVRSGTFA